MSKPATLPLHQRDDQRGAALIIALVIVAMATILAATLMWETHMDIRRTANQLYGAEALANALGVEDFVRDVLAQDDRESDHLQEPWARQGDIFPIEGGSLSGGVLDLQSRFNVNNLLNDQGEPDEAQIKNFLALVTSLGIDARIVDAAVDWMDANVNAMTYGAEDDTYLRLNPAYRTANRPFSSVSELRLLANMTPEQFAVLEPYVTTLPTRTTVNINTAAPELLVALGDLAPDAAARIVEMQSQGGFASLADAQDVVGGNALDANTFGVTSNYFRLQVLAVIGSSRLTLYSALHRDANGGVVRVLSRSLGTP